MGLGNLVKKLIFTLAFTTAVTFGCDGKPPVKPIPLTEAECTAVSYDASHHILEQQDKIFVSSDGEEKLLVEDTVDYDYSVIGCIGDKYVLILEKDKNSANNSHDVVLFDLETLIKVFDTDSPDFDDSVYCFIEDGKKVLMTEYRYLTRATKLFIIDPNTKTKENIFPGFYGMKFITDKNAKIKLIKATDSVGRYKMYSFDSKTSETKLITGNKNVSTSHIYPIFTSDVITGKDRGNVVFYFNNGNSEKWFNYSDPDYDLDIIGISSDSKKGLIKEVKGDKKDTRFYCFDILTGTDIKIDFSAFIGWDGNDVPANKVSMTQNNIVINGKSINPLLPNVLVYHIPSNSVEDIINTFYSGLDTEDEELTKKLGNACLITLKAETSPGSNLVNQILHYSGNNLTNTFSAYSGNVNTIFDNDKYSLITAETNTETHLLIYNMETNTFNVLENNYVSSEEHKFSINEKMLAYVTELNNEDSLNIYDIENDILRKDLKQDTEIINKFFNRNDTNLISKQRTNLTEPFTVTNREINSGEEKEICKEQ